MASYKAGFDPPTRPGENVRGRRLGAYMQQHQQGSAMPDQKETDASNATLQADPKRGHIPLARPYGSSVPRPSIRAPSPNTSSNPDPRHRGITASSFGFGRPAPRTMAREEPAIQLKGKSSRNVLRRKQSSIAQIPANSRPSAETAEAAPPKKSSQPSTERTSTERRPSVNTALRSAEAYNDIFARNRSRVQPPSSTSAKDSPPIIPELDRYRGRSDYNAGSTRIGVPHKLATHDLPPPTPLLSGTPGYSGGSNHHRYSGYSGSGYSASPSTRFSESPGPGAYSRDTTPTSMSSQSPGIMAPVKGPATPRLGQASPAHTRPPITRRRAGSHPLEPEALVSDGLPALRESGLSSSSNSTVKDDGRNKEKPKKKRLSPLPPSPPPRKSSQKFKPSPRKEEESPSKPSHTPAEPVMISPFLGSSPRMRSAASASPARPIVPSRPSREGAPDLQSQLGDTMKVIQSNLAGISYAQDKRKSLTSRPTIPPPQASFSSRSQQSSRLPSRNPSPSPIMPSAREATPAPSGLGIIPVLRPQQMPPSSRGTASRTPSPSIANAKPRFGLFGRRTKTAPEIPTINTEKVTRKGPAAGTGHEGYGRYGLRGRSTSATGQSRNTGGNTPASPITRDSFLLERMSPVIIAGGGEIVENRNTSVDLYRAESNNSMILGRVNMESRGSNRSRMSSEERQQTTLQPSALPREPNKRASGIVAPKGRRPSDSSDDGYAKSGMTFGRSIRLNTSTTALNPLKPVKKTSTGASASLVSLGASVLSEDSRPESERVRKGQLTKTRKLEKRPKSPTKWNFFHRKPTVKPQEPQAPLQVKVGKPAAKPIPHYAMLDSSDENQEVDPMELEEILREADAAVVDLTNEELDMLQFGETYKDNIKRMEEIETMVATPVLEHPPAPVIFSSPKSIEVTTPDIFRKDLHMDQKTAPPRPSRLPQVGRIPKVISARPEATSPKSFSRPFNRLSIQQPMQVPIMLDKASVAAGPSPPKPSTPEPLHTKHDSEDLKGAFRQESGDSKMTDSTLPSQGDFLSFSPRKNSEATTNTSSSGGLSLTGITAVIPGPDAALEEDEVWDEYDDLIEGGGVVRAPSSASSQGMPFYLERYASRRLRKSKVPGKESPLLTSTPQIAELSADPPRQSFQTTSSVYSTDVNPKLKEAIAAIPSPTTPLSFTDFFSGYGDRNNSAAKNPMHSSHSSKDSKSSSQGSRSSSLLASIAAQESSTPVSQVNLRVGSMTVSKWLTFGHVLFSPAREQIENTASEIPHSILVIDGLGNDDWSFYAAETYPKTHIFNLSPTHASTSTTPTSPIANPSNHTQVQFPSLSTLHTRRKQPPFPFPANHFALIILRFPPSLPQRTYTHLLAEVHRVLKPGGYLEMTLLEIDMLNMGSRTRRAVRGLKCGMKEKDEGVFLGSIGDFILRELLDGDGGESGNEEMKWEGVKSCGVGIPVVSLVGKGDDKSSRRGSRGSQSSTRAVVGNMNNAPPRTRDNRRGGSGSSATPGMGNSSTATMQRQSQQMSLAEMISSSGVGSAAGINGAKEKVSNECIGSMVARVGRWWYNRVYENGVAVASGVDGAGVFGDSKVLGECEAWGTGFRLVVGFARKCEEGKRRVGRRRGISI